MTEVAEMTPADYARHANVSRQAVGKMMASGKIPFREDGGKKLIDPIAADRARGQNIARILSDAADDEDEAPVVAGGSSSATMTANKAKREGILAQLAELELNERLANLRPVGDFTVATQRCAEVAIRALDRLPGRADELVAMIAKDGKLGAREGLRRIVRDLRKVMADEFSRLASGETLKEVEREGGEQAATE